MEYYSAKRKDEIPPIVTTWIDFENIMLSEITQRKLRTIWVHSCARYKTKIHRHRQHYSGYQSKVKGGQIYGDGRWFDFDDGHIMQYRDHVSYKCGLGTYVTHVTPMSLVKNNYC